MTSISSRLRTASQPTVLLAEDDPDQSDSLRETLEDEGYAVETAFSGDTALQKLLARKYDVVILDVRMPGLDGATVLRQLRQCPEKAGLPVVLVSAFASEADMQRYRAQGANASFAKPFDVKELLVTIATLRAGKRRSGRFTALPR
jgi:DNA-binding response OmpR family regulator